MAFCERPARLRARWLSFVCLLSMGHAAQALEVNEALRSDNIPLYFNVSLGRDSKGAIQPTRDGILVSAENNRFALLKIENDVPGTDVVPLIANVRIRTAPGHDGQMLPGMTFYWDAKNYAFFHVTHDTHLYYGWVKDGEDNTFYEHNVMRDSRLADAKFAGKEVFVRILLVSKNMAFFVSHDGVSWRKLAEADVRPGPELQSGAGAVPQIILGRGMAGRQPDLCNNLSRDKRPLVKAYFSELHVSAHAPAVKPDVPDVAKKETWEQTLSALEPAGIPHAWSFLSPGGEKAFWDAASREWLQNDNWSTIKELGGKPVKYFLWNRPDDELEDSSVDLRERVEPAKNATVLCKAEIEWPVSGEALLWFDSIEPCKLLVNNVLAYDYSGNEWWREKRPVKDRTAIPVWFEKGKNTVKILIKTVRADSSFFLRAERNDPARRVGLCEKMLELYPLPASGWRGTQAMLDLARADEDSFDFIGALGRYDAALKTLKMDEEGRLRAFEGKLRVHHFLRDFDGAVKTADAYLAAFPNESGADCARRAAVKYETLAGRVSAARERARTWSALSEADTLRVAAGALAEAGNRAGHLAMLDEIAGAKALSAEERARAAIESACWRWEYEHRRCSRGATADPGEQERAVRAMLKAIDILPGGKGAAVQRVVQDTEEELKNKHPERAYGAAWGGALMAQLATDPETAYYCALNKALPVAFPILDKNGKEIQDQNQFRDAAWKLVREACGDPMWSGKWRIVSFKRSRDGKAPAEISGPETNADAGARYGDRTWQEIDPENDKTERTEFGFDVRRFSGDGQIVYLARDFDASAAGDSVLQLSNAGTWSAWVDGKLVGRDLSADQFRIEADRIPLHLEKGRHRVLIRLELPAEGGVAFRARIGSEPHLAMLVYVQALCARQFPSSAYDRLGDLNQLRETMARRTRPEALMAFCQAVSQMYDDQKWNALDQLTWAAQVLHESNQDAQSVRALRIALQRLEESAEFQGRAAKVLEVARALARALVHEGNIVAADVVLRDASNRYPAPRQDWAHCVALRGTLRWELGMSQAALPFFERSAREGRLSDEARALVAPGLDWSRFTRPERVTFESSRDVQALLDGVQRQLAGAPDDVEKAMRGLGDVLRSTGNSLVRVAETPFAVRYVGVREYIRTMLDAMTVEQRGVYRKVVGEAAAQRLLRVAANDPAELEKAALEFPYTRESQRALNRAGDLYFDRGRYGQAASIYLTILREPNTAESAGAVCAKLAVAQALHGDAVDAAGSVKRLSGEFAGTTVRVKGEDLKGAILAERLAQQIAGMNGGAQRADSGEYPYMGSLARTGAMKEAAPEPGGVAWAQSVIASGALDTAKSVFGIDPIAHLQPVPVTDGSRVFVGAMESLRAFDLNSGEILWTQTWAGGPAGAQSSNGSFNGFPTSCPLVTGGKVIARAQSLTSSLKCFDAATGAVRWSSDGQPELKRLVWISDAAAAYGMVFAVFMEPGDFNIHGVAALDAESGRLRWRTNLASGATGIKVGQSYFQAATHMGPPALDAGELYVETGLASVAAINAFTGEARWLSSYPRMQLGDLRRGNTGAFDWTLHSVKTFSRAPLPPMVLGNLVAASPHDGNGVIAFDRRDGTVLWHREMVSCRYVAGIAGGKILACDDGVTALDAETGATAWRLNPNDGQTLQGAPTLSGGVLYLPLRSGLLRIDALKGAALGSTPWDSRVGPIANLLITPNRLVGVSEQSVAGLGTGGSGTNALPLYEAKRLESEGKLEEAAQRYADAQAVMKTDLPLTLTARIRLLKRLGKRDEALAEIARFEREAPANLSAMGGLWTTRREDIARSLRQSLGEHPAEANPDKADGENLAGVLAYASFLPGENPQLARFPNDPPNRLYARLNGDIQCLLIGESAAIQWSAYVGTNVKFLASGDSYLAAASDREITVLDRLSGETLSQIIIANLDSGAPKVKHGAFKKKSVTQGESFTQVCVENGAVFAATETRLGAWDAVSGKPLWERALIDTRSINNGLSARDGKLVRVYQHKDDILITSYDCATGNEVQTLPAERQQRIAFSPDRHYMIARWQTRFSCIDLWKMTVLWRKELDDLDVTYSSLEFTPEGQIRYAGPDRRNGGRRTVRHLDVVTGNDTAPRVVDGQGVQSEGGMYSITDRGFKISRLKFVKDAAAPAGSDVVWTTRLPYQQGVDYTLLNAFVAGPFFHSVSLRTFENGSREQLVLRTLAWETGVRISEEILPGSPIIGTNPYTNLKSVNTVLMQTGGSLVYTAREGVFSLRPRGGTVAQAAEKFREELRKPDASPERVKHLRRGLAGLEQPEAMAFVTPTGSRIDGDMSEWAGTEPAMLASRADYVPLSDGAAWGGAGELSAKIYTGWNRDGVTVAVDVTDASPVSPQPGNELATGDRVRIAIDSRDSENAVFDPNECFVATLALVQGSSFYAQEFGVVPESGPRAEGRVTPSVSGRGRQYELFVPWSVLRKNSNERPGDKRELRLGVAVFDGTPNGTRGALEWGAGATVHGAMPVWLGKLSLIDVSAEKVERYRKVIGMAPGSPEALKFLRLIMLSKRGPTAEAERIGEMEKFVTENPDSTNTAKVLGMLRDAYRRVAATGGAAEARLEKLVKNAKISDRVRQALDEAFRMWVYTDPEKPPQMIMVQFSNGDFTNGVARAYWGAPALLWAREGSNQLKRIGDLPKPGQWTELRVSPYDLDLENLEIKVFALTAAGGPVYFSRIGCISVGKEKVLIDGKLREKWQTQYSELKFVDQPARDGVKSMTFGSFWRNDTIGVYNTHFNLEGWTPIMSFEGVRLWDEAAKNPARYQETCRRVARIIDDTPEGLAFLRRAIDMNEGDDKQRSAKALAEIKEFMKQSSGSVNACEATKLAYEYYVRGGAADPMAKIGEFIRETKPPISATRAFYAERVPGWTEWRVLGPFVALGERRGMETSLEPEKSVDLEFKTQNNGRDIAWKKISAKGKNGESLVDMRLHLSAEKESYRGPYFGYAYARFNCPDKRKALLAFGADDVVSIWVNGKRVVNELYTGAQKDKETEEVQLRSGENEILIKVGVQRDRLAFYFRLADLDGRPFDDISNE